MTIILDDIKKMNDEKLLFEIAKNESDPTIRIAAARRLYNAEMLLHIVKTDKNMSVCEKVLKHLVFQIMFTEFRPRIIFEDENPFVEIALHSISPDMRRVAADAVKSETALLRLVNSDDAEIRRHVAKKIANKDAICFFARKDSDYEVRILAIRKVTDEEVLADVALHDDEWRVRCEAVQRLTDEKILAKIAMKDKMNFVRYDAIKRMNDTTTLLHIAQNHDDYNCRSWAVTRLTDKRVFQ